MGAIVSPDQIRCTVFNPEAYGSSNVKTERVLEIEIFDRLFEIELSQVSQEILEQYELIDLAHENGENVLEAAFMQSSNGEFLELKYFSSPEQTTLLFIIQLKKDFTNHYNKGWKYSLVKFSTTQD